MSFANISFKICSLNGLASLLKIRISNTALHYRFTAKAVLFMKTVVSELLTDKIKNTAKINNDFLNQFAGIKIIDATSWDISAKLKSLLPGSGGAASKANCKVQLIYEYISGTIEFFDITPGNKPDSKYTNNIPQHLNKNDLCIFDLGYFKFSVFNKIIEIGAYFLSRYRTGSILFDAKTGIKLNFAKELSKLAGDIYESEVIIGKEKNNQLKCRIVALRAPKEVAEQRRRKARKEASKKGRTVSKQKSNLCDWTIFITNIPVEMVAAEMMFVFYKIRWQIELIFKQFKSILHIHKSDTSNIHRLYCEIYGKMIVAIFVQQIHGFYNAQFLNKQNREISMDKLYKRIQERSIIIYEKLNISILATIKYLRLEIKRLLKQCLKGKQNTKKTTFEMLKSMN